MHGASDMGKLRLHRIDALQWAGTNGMSLTRCAFECRRNAQQGAGRAKVPGILPYPR